MPGAEQFQGRGLVHGGDSEPGAELDARPRRELVHEAHQEPRPDAGHAPLKTAASIASGSAWPGWRRARRPPRRRAAKVYAAAIRSRRASIRSIQARSAGVNRPRAVVRPSRSADRPRGAVVATSQPGRARRDSRPRCAAFVSPASCGRRALMRPIRRMVRYGNAAAAKSHRHHREYQALGARIGSAQRTRRSPHACASGQVHRRQP